MSNVPLFVKVVNKVVADFAIFNLESVRELAGVENFVTNFFGGLDFGGHLISPVGLFVWSIKVNYTAVQ